MGIKVAHMPKRPMNITEQKLKDVNFILIRGSETVRALVRQIDSIYWANMICRLNAGSAVNIK
jgi:hypothetical protein